MTVENQYSAEAHEKPMAFVRHTWNRSGARSLVFEKPDELSLAEEATGVEYEPLYAAAHARRPDAGAAVEARRYRRLQILGAAPFGSKNLDTGTVLRFQSLDAFVDADISAHPSRGESAQPEAAQPQPKGTTVEEAAKAVFQQLAGWCGQPWVEGGNSLKQDEARRYASAALSAVQAPAPTHPLDELTANAEALGLYDDPTHGCKRCGASMAPGKAIAQTYTSGSPDFPGDKAGMTMIPGGPGVLVECLKCSACGWSVTAGAANSQARSST